MDPYGKSELVKEGRSLCFMLYRNETIIIRNLSKLGIMKIKIRIKERKRSITIKVKLIEVNNKQMAVAYFASERTCQMRLLYKLKNME